MLLFMRLYSINPEITEYNKSYALLKLSSKVNTNSGSPVSYQVKDAFIIRLYGFVTDEVYKLSTEINDCKTIN